MPSVNKPLAEPMLTQICVDIWCASLGHNELRSNSHSPAYIFAPRVMKFCIVGTIVTPACHTFCNSRDKIVESRGGGY